MAPKWLFCEANSVLLDWKKLGRGILKRERIANDTHLGTRNKRILSHPLRRIKSAVLTMLVVMTNDFNNLKLRQDISAQ